jgi:DNA-binding MarR family transcriptional regulator
MGKKGSPLHPAQLAELADLYAELGNAAAVARALSVSTSTVTRALDRLGKQRRATLQSNALLSGLRDGRERLERATRGVSTKLWLALKKNEPQPKGSTLFESEPQSIQQLGSTLARLITVQIALDRREEQRLQSRLTRKRTRAEIALLAKKFAETQGPAGGDPIDASDPRWKALQEQVYGAARQGVSANDGAEPARPDGDPDAVAEG